jgi:hypothetical protein
MQWLYLNAAETKSFGGVWPAEGFGEEPQPARTTRLAAAAAVNGMVPRRNVWGLALAAGMHAPPLRGLGLGRREL